MSTEDRSVAWACSGSVYASARVCQDVRGLVAASVAVSSRRFALAGPADCGVMVLIVAGRQLAGTHALHAGAAVVSVWRAVRRMPAINERDDREGSSLLQARCAAGGEGGGEVRVFPISQLPGRHRDDGGKI